MLKNLLQSNVFEIFLATRSQGRHIFFFEDKQAIRNRIILFLQVSHHQLWSFDFPPENDNDFHSAYFAITAQISLSFSVSPVVRNSEGTTFF